MMFGWRKRNEGFEWREYVRTTILVRRRDRQRRMDDVREAALAKVKDARDKGFEAGLRQVDAVRGGAKGAAERAGSAIKEAGLAAARKAADAGRQGAAGAAQLLQAVPRPALPEAAKSSASLAALYAGDVPRRWRLIKPYLLPAAGASAAVFVFGAALAPQLDLSPGTGGSVQASSSDLETGSIARAASESADGVVSGRANAISGDAIRIGGTLIRLAGIDAPPAAQPCTKANGRKWACAASATGVLARMIRGRKVSCELQGSVAGDGHNIAHCRVGDADIAATLVRKGAVFAADTLGNPYAGEEDAARAEKLGLWQGNAERPEAWRAKIWDEAKRAAPDGCPIKGLVRSEGRIYAMPWSDGYGARALKPAKGERWFCSEDEARAAGFRLATRS